MLRSQDIPFDTVKSIHRISATVLVLRFCASFLFAHEHDFESSVTEGPTPWTHLEFQDDPNNFQFAMVTDRTGSPRPGIFEDAVKKLNWLMPEFVMSVGDLIRGSGKDEAEIEQEWEAFDGMVESLKMPFFYLAGNHDIRAKIQSSTATTEEMTRQWNQRLGPTYYYYVYKNVLFLALFSNDGLEQNITQEQVNYFAKVLKDHPDVRWTLVFLHHPLWTYPHKSNFDQVEALLADRKHTVFAGHQHYYRHFERNNSNYYILATTGGGSPLLGNHFGQFDHVTWVTMTDEGPILANLRLDGILPHDVSSTESALLGKHLVDSSFIDSQVFLDGDNSIKGGVAYITVKNTADEELHVDGRFFHSHHLTASPSSLSVIVPPESSKTIEVKLDAIRKFSTKDKVVLEFDGTLGFDVKKYPGFTVSGVKTIRINNSTFDVLPTRKAVFTDQYHVSFSKAIPGTEIRYTLDGSKPTPKSPRYTESFLVSKSSEVKARLFTKDGYSSETDTMILEKIKPGAGLLCDVFEYIEEKGRWNSVPKFRQMKPLVTKVVHELNPARAAGREEFFGLVYRGSMNLTEAGEYTFTTLSDDGIVVFVDGEKIVVDDVKHPVRETTGHPIRLFKGKHTIEIHYFQHKREFDLQLLYAINNGKKKSVPFSWFSYE